MRRFVGAWVPRSLSEWRQLRDRYVKLCVLLGFTQDLPTRSGVDGEFELVFGTSASAPVVGSIFTLVNDARLAIGKRPVGWLNPLVRDISFFLSRPYINNSVCAADLFTHLPRGIQRHHVGRQSRLRDRRVHRVSFWLLSRDIWLWHSSFILRRRTKGWDPVTGVGTPDLSKILPLALLLP